MEASELFAICEQLAAAAPADEATRRLHEVLVLVCAEGCRQQGGAFGNLFAQVDFLCKRLGLNAMQSRDLQTARRHSNPGKAIGAADWSYDVKAVAQLVAAVFSKDIPGSLRQRLPSDQRQHAKGLRINKDYIRCIVNRFDEHTIWAETEDGEVTVDYANTDSGRDFGYLRKLLRPGMQLNLLDNHVAGTVVPGQVIAEPDFLIDISALAACFTPYGHHPLIYTVNRLKDTPNTQATLLGNFADTALDEAINRSTAGAEGDGGEDDSPSTVFGRAFMRSFREQALRFCACPGLDPQKFRKQAQALTKNICEAAGLLAPLLKQGMGALLEPSFVCERLGLQGRVDLMTVPSATERSMLLVEQKSGKNMKIEYQSHDSHGLQLEKHYVQLLLYYGVLRYNFGLSDRLADTRLLYSRYPAAQGLLTVNYYRALLREALQLRNQIVCTELLIAREGACRILPLLNADVIYKGIARDGYFHRYILPEITVLHTQIATLTPLERAYYECMLTFVYREQAAAKLGSAETRLHHSGGCTADLWQMSPAEKMETGNIILGEMEKTDGQLVHLSLPTSFLFSSILNFRCGDMVYLYSYTDDPDVRRSILFKGTLQELTPGRLVVALHESQRNAAVFRREEGRHWAVEHGSSDMGTGGAVRSLHRFITSPSRRKALLLGQRAPEADDSQRLSRSYHPDYDEVLLGIRQARDYYLLAGPPGTGKTSMALRFIVEEELASHQHSRPQILLTAYTNRAVDEICAMLCTLHRPQEGLVRPFLRLGKAASCDARFRSCLLDTVLASTHRLDEARQLIAETPVIVATTSMLLSQPYLLELKHFSLAVVDEASQILEPAIVGLLCHPAIDRFVLMGDHKQLPAVVQQAPELSAVSDPVLNAIGLEDCRQSLFERLLRWEQRQQRTRFTGTLRTHGRMHPLVARFPLEHFYQREQLCPVPLPHQQELSLGYGQPSVDPLDERLKRQRLLFLPCQGDEDAEARLVADLLRRIYRFTAPAFDPAKTVGVIVPYRRQIALIRQHLAPLPPALSDISIDTVERYQGSQRDVVIYSFAISHSYQLDFLTAATFTDEDGTTIDRKLNVALTRARRQMIVTGRPDLLAAIPLFSRLMQEYGEVSCPEVAEQPGKAM